MPHIEPCTVAVAAGTRPARADAQAQRIIERRQGLPGGRAAVGGLLIALSAIGVFLAYERASEGPTQQVVVAARPLRAGEMIESDDLRVIAADLPSATRRTAFESPETLVGRIALGPIGVSEILQRGLVSDESPGRLAHEIAITLPRDQIAVGRLKQGDRVDVFVTYDERTTSVVRGAEVVQIGSGDDGSLTSERELSVVIAVASGDDVASLVHALRTGEVTVVRSTFAQAQGSEPLEFDSSAGAPTGGDDR